MKSESHHCAKSQTLISRACPEYNCDKQICQASIRQMIPSRHLQMRYCANDYYDNCPLYLSKALRSCRTQGLDRDSILLSGK